MVIFVPHLFRESCQKICADNSPDQMKSKLTYRSFVLASKNKKTAQTLFQITFDLFCSRLCFFFKGGRGGVTLGYLCKFLISVGVAGNLTKPAGNECPSISLNALPQGGVEMGGARCLIQSLIEKNLSFFKDLKR